MSSEPPPSLENSPAGQRVVRWRKRQVISVALGNLAAILGLVGAAIVNLALLAVGAVLFVGCLVSIVFCGLAAARAARDLPKP